MRADHIPLSLELDAVSAAFAAARRDEPSDVAHELQRLATLHPGVPRRTVQRLIRRETVLIGQQAQR